LFKNLKIFQKLAISYFLIGVATVIVISLIFYLAFKKALIQRTSAQLSSVNILKEAQIREHFKFRMANLKMYSTDPEMLRAVIHYSRRETLQNTHGNYEEYLQHLKKDLNYKTLILLDTLGEIIYAADSGSPVSRLLRREGRSNAALRHFLHNGLNDFLLFDATALLHGGTTAILMSLPIRTEGRSLGEVIFEKNFSEIENILFERTGMGKTGESYLVGADGFMRSSSRFFPEKSPYTIHVNTKAVVKAFNNIEEASIIKDYRGETVLSAYRKLNISGLPWVIISEIDFEEALTPVYAIRNYIIATGSVLILLIVLITLFLSRKISRPILELKEIILQLSKGILTEEIKISGNDEIGEMTKAIDGLISGLKRTSGFAYEIGNGDFRTQFLPLSNQDILGASLLQMRDKLKLLQKKEAAIMRERSSALLEGQEKERRRIAMELHDGIGQMLTVIRFKVSALDGHEQFQKETKALLDDTIAEVRRISNNVMPSVLLDFGLESALKTLCSNTQKYTDMKVDFTFIHEKDITINFEASVSLYRIAQEALNNTVKYAKADHATVSVIQRGNSICMEINDNGKGFDIKEYDLKGKLSNGIKNMRERIRLLQGKFEISSVENEGTEIKAEIPLFNQ
jgi:two-component system NarL family sensor kinase